MNISNRIFLSVILAAAILGSVLALIISRPAYAADIDVANCARITAGLSLQECVAVLGMEAQVTVLSANVIELTWFSRDYRTCLCVVFVDGRALTKNRRAITNLPALDQVPANVGEQK